MTGCAGKLDLDTPERPAAGTRTAANGLLGTLHTLYPHRSTRDLWHMVGVTEMIGIDDYGSGGETGPLEILTLADTKNVTAWARDKDIAELSFWALGRDNGGCPGTPGSDDCSGVPCTSFLWPSMKVSFVLTRRR
jgi:hypothetical protein